MDRIVIFDTTLRDGEQAPGFSMNVEEKLKMARQLERLQVDIIEAGFPVASEGDFEAVENISAEIRTVTIAGVARAVPVDIDPSWQALEGAARTPPYPYLPGDQRYPPQIQIQQDARRSARYRRESCRAGAEALRRSGVFGGGRGPDRD